MPLMVVSIASAAVVLVAVSLWFAQTLREPYRPGAPISISMLPPPILDAMVELERAGYSLSQASLLTFDGGSIYCGVAVSNDRLHEVRLRLATASDFVFRSNMETEAVSVFARGVLITSNVVGGGVASTEVVQTGFGCDTATIIAGHLSVLSALVDRMARPNELSPELSLERLERERIRGSEALQGRGMMIGILVVWRSLFRLPRYRSPIESSRRLRSIAKRLV